MITTHQLTDSQGLLRFPLPTRIFGLRWDLGLSRGEFDERFNAENGWAVYHMVEDEFGDYMGSLVESSRDIKFPVLPLT